MVERTSHKPIYLAMEDNKIASSIIQMIRRYPSLETLRVAKPPAKLAIFMVEAEPSVLVIDSDIAPALVVKAKSRIPELCVVVVAAREEIFKQPANPNLATRALPSDCDQKELHTLLDQLLNRQRKKVKSAPVADMIAYLSFGDYHGSLEIRNSDSGEQGTIGFSNGGVVNAELNGQHGADAVTEMKKWQACTFRWTQMIESIDEHFEDIESPVGNVSDFLHYEAGLVEATDTSMFPMAFADNKSSKNKSDAGFMPSSLTDSKPKENESKSSKKPAQKQSPTLSSKTETFVPSKTQDSTVNSAVSHSSGVSGDASSHNVPNPKETEQPTNPIIGALMASNATEILQELTGIAGFIAGAVVDSDSGMTLAKISNSMSFDIDVAAATNTEVIKAKLRAAKALKLEDGIEDILITLTHQYHLLRPLEEYPSIFFYCALDREQANLAMARIKLKTVGSKIKL